MPPHLGHLDPVQPFQALGRARDTTAMSSATSLRHDLSQPLVQMPPLGFVAHQRERSSIPFCGLSVAAKPAQQLGPRGGQQVILGKPATVVELVHQGQAAFRG